MDNDCYKSSLDKVLTDVCVEDMKEHGRLIVLKEKLISFLPKNEKKVLNRLAKFQLKDFTRGNTETEENLADGNDVDFNPE
jgi:hypothetical protein